jgi:hypothetical protein
MLLVAPRQKRKMKVESLWSSMIELMTSWKVRGHLGASWLVMKGADEDKVGRGDDHQCCEGSKRKVVLAWRERKECKEDK